MVGRTGFTVSSFTIGWYGVGGLMGLLAGPIAAVVFKRTLGGRSDRRADAT
jgi:predicted PurR-regulated permease PerM